MVRHPRVIYFEIVYYRRKKPIKLPISELYLFEFQLFRQGFASVRKIIFYFDANSYHYPYGIHNIILEVTEEDIEIVFYHYYNSANQCVTLCIDQQKCDYDALRRSLEHSLLLPLIRPCFI